MNFLVATLLIVLAIFLILLVLVQRGRGGGLTGALGGMGGSSAFGAKAGDVFTRITIVVAGVWIASCALAGYWANNRGDRLGRLSTPPPVSSPALMSPSGTEDTSSGDSTTTATPHPESTGPNTTNGPAVPSSGASESSGEAPAAE